MIFLETVGYLSVYDTVYLIRTYSISSHRSLVLLVMLRGFHETEGVVSALGRACFVNRRYNFVDDIFALTVLYFQRIDLEIM